MLVNNSQTYVLSCRAWIKMPSEEMLNRVGVDPTEEELANFITWCDLYVSIDDVAFATRFAKQHLPDTYFGQPVVWTVTQFEKTWYNRNGTKQKPYSKNKILEEVRHKASLI